MFVTAPLIHNGHQFLPEGTVIEVNEDGIISAIHNGYNGKNIIEHDGILCPGFVNAHCHLELSHLKNMLPEHTGLIPFLQKIPSYRTSFTDEQKKSARHEAHQELINNGVVAVGDIANVEDTIDLRQLNKLHFHTFIECIGFTETHARQRFEAALTVYEIFATQEQNEKLLRQSIVPHAPYSVSRMVFELIDKHQPDSIISIHNQESIAEDQYYKEKKGDVKNLLQGFGIDDNFFSFSGTSSLRTYAEWLSVKHSCLLVHNTFTAREDVQFALDRFEKTFWCLCPNANLYIENTLPEVNTLLQSGAAICIGTDSLASNHQLSVLSELHTLKQNFPYLKWEALLTWGTLHGALALNMKEIIGSLEIGKKPGILNITHLESSPQVQRII